jgi:hypothetical protein
MRGARPTLLLAVAALALAVPSIPQAQVATRIRHMGFPATLPPLVEVQPGIQVVQDFSEEIFFVDSSYWTLNQGHWYRTWDHRSTWYLAKPRDIPAALARHRPGQYRNWQHDERRGWPAASLDRVDRHWAPADRRAQVMLQHPLARQEAARR